MERVTFRVNQKADTVSVTFLMVLVLEKLTEFFHHPSHKAGLQNFL